MLELNNHIIILESNLKRYKEIIEESKASFINAELIKLEAA